MIVRKVIRHQSSDMTVTVLFMYDIVWLDSDIMPLGEIFIKHICYYKAIAKHGYYNNDCVEYFL